MNVGHSLFQARFDMMADYISCPKDIGYSALHTGIYINDDFCIEVRMLSEDMEKKSQFGFFYNADSTSMEKILKELIQLEKISKDKKNSTLK